MQARSAPKLPKPTQKVSLKSTASFKIACLNPISTSRSRPSRNNISSRSARGEAMSKNVGINASVYQNVPRGWEVRLLRKICGLLLGQVSFQVHDIARRAQYRLIALTLQIPSHADQILQVRQAHIRPLKGEYCSITGIVPSLSRGFSITRIVMGYFESSHKV